MVSTVLVQGSIQAHIVKKVLCLIQNQISDAQKFQMTVTATFTDQRPTHVTQRNKHSGTSCQIDSRCISITSIPDHRGSELI